MAAWKALLAQLAGWAAAAFLLLPFPSLAQAPLGLALVQGALAALASRLLKAAHWWLPIHVSFIPAVVLAGRLALPPWLYLTAFVLMLLVYWRTFRGEVPLYLSSRETARAAARLLPERSGLRVADLGAGTGGVLAELAAARPDARCLGLEHAPLPYLLARLRCARLPNCQVLRTDFWRHCLADMDAVYVFLSPAVMERLWRKASREMAPGTLLISSRFPVPDVAPERVVPVAGAGHVLYCYRIG
jgi:SAM-dependent methyltransferase